MDLNHECLGRNAGKLYLGRYDNHKKECSYIPLVNTYTFMTEAWFRLIENRFDITYIGIKGIGEDLMEFRYINTDYWIEFFKTEPVSVTPTKEQTQIAKLLKGFLAEQEELPKKLKKDCFFILKKDAFLSPMRGHCNGYLDKECSWTLDISKGQPFFSRQEAKRFIDGNFDGSKQYVVVEGETEYWDFVRKNYTDRKDFAKLLEENKTDFILVQKGKGHYNIVGFDTIITSEGDTTLVLKLGERIEK